MRHFDHNSEFGELNLPKEIRAILEATAHNKRLFSKSQTSDDDNFTTGSLRYQREDRDRPDFRSLDELPDEYTEDDDLVSILDFFGYSDSALRFQLESWAAIQPQLEEVKDDDNDEDRGAVITAPTGFGKTAAFLGPIFNNAAYDGGERAILVYPSRALLKDQLGRILEIVHRVNNDEQFSDANEISVGAWMGKQPWERGDVLTNGRSFVDTSATPAELSVASHWTDDQSTFYVEERDKPWNTGYRVFDEEYRRNRDEGVEFTEEELLLHREGIKSDNHNRPDILLTTLESLETLAAKPHYDLVLDADFFVFDEIHQYQGLRGSHAAEIIKNIRRIREKNAVFIGSSATVEDPHSFAAKLFGFDSQTIDDVDDLNATKHDLVALSPHRSDIDQTNDDALHYYFMLTDPEGEPGVASQYLQHAMMVGRSLLEPVKSDPKTDDRSSTRTGNTESDSFELDDAPERRDSDDVQGEEAEPPSIPDGGATSAEGSDQPTERRKLLAFIQSKSQINRLRNQFSNADKARKLWQYHRHYGEGDWAELAERTGHEFLDRTDALDDPLPIYSGSPNSVDQIDDADIIHGTSFLEVGVDISNLHYISQYRPPENITSFRQRAGRAAREKGNSGHVFVHLSDWAGDANFHYRADRFLDSEVTTPLWTNNRVISWMHDRFYRYYEVLEEFQNDDEIEGWWSDDSNAPALVRRYFGSELGWDRFADFLLEPSSYLGSIMGIQVSDGHLLQGGLPADQLDRKLDQRLDELRERLSTIQQFLSEDADELLLDDDAVASFVVEMSKSAMNLLDEMPDEVDDENVTETHDRLRDIAHSSDPSMKVDDFLEASSRVAGLLEMHSMSFETGAYPERRVEDLREAKSALRDATEGDELENLADTRTIIYNLQQVVEQVRQYRRFYRAHHGQLNAIKHLFQAAYYYDRCLRVTDEEPSFRLNSDLIEGNHGPLKEKYEDEPEAQIWYVPPNYFNDAGRYFTLEKPPDEEWKDNDRVETSVTQLLSQYIPFKVDHRPGTGECQVFQPRVTIDERGNQKLDFANVKGEDPATWLRIPDRLELDPVTDHSLDKAQSVYAFDEEEFKVLTDDDLEKRSGEPDYAKLFSTVNIGTQVNQLPDGTARSSGNLSLSEVDAKAWIESMTVDVAPQMNIGSRKDPKFIADDSKPEKTYHLESTTPKLGYALKTRAICWDLSRFFSRFEDDDGTIDEDALTACIRQISDGVPEGAEAYKSFDNVDPVEATYITAAHLLELFVADIAGVETNLLLYGYDEEKHEVYVFEQTEGGQGIVDLFFDHLTGRPALALNSLYRLLHNPQILNERIWTDESAVQRLYSSVDLEALTTGSEEVRDDELEHMREVVEDVLAISYPRSVDRIAEETASTLERIYQNSSDSVAKDTLFELKHELASVRVRGNCPTDENGEPEIPQEVLNEYRIIIDEIGYQTVKSLFFPPDVDDCEMNLQLERSVTDIPQEEALSNVLLEQLEDYIVDRVPKEREREEVMDREQYWAWFDETEDDVLFLRW